MLQVICVSVIVIAMTMLVTRLKQKTPKRLFQCVVWGVFVCYLCGNFYFTLLSRTIGTGTQVDLVPFQSYLKLFEKPSSDVTSVSGLAALALKELMPIEGIILNTLLYYPLGYLLPILFPKLKPKHVILIGCLCSIATEATQYLLKMGWCETDDVIHNTLGTAIGVWVWYLQYKRLNKHSVKTSLTGILRKVIRGRV